LTQVPAVPTDPSGTSHDLVSASRRVLLDGQAPSGAIIASPSFATYRFAWLRDGSYCAMALDALGETEAAARFHRWVADVVHRMHDRVDLVVQARAAGRTPDQAVMLPTRYTLEGEEEPEAVEEWPNFQLDGYGTWLFALDRHLGDRPTPPELRPGIEDAARYLAATWQLPCYDYWEEYGDRQHTSTLASVVAGLRAAARRLGDAAYASVADQVWDTMLGSCLHGGRFAKGPQDARVDASLLSLALPFRLLPPDDPRIVDTVAAIRSDLVPRSGGVRRYLGDSYYGGGSWILLTCWLGWYAVVSGDRPGFQAARDWTAAHAGAGLTLAEQVLDEVQHPEFVEPWVQRWGPVADPLLWSHAKYVLMQTAAVGRWT
jgi:GH15 family glucan-1,4-alpha-glucosidase